MEKGNILLRVSLMDLVYVMAEISCGSMEVLRS